MCRFVHTNAPNIACFHHLTCGKEDTLLVAFIEFSSIWECCGHMGTAQSLAVQSKALPSYHHWPAVRGCCVSTSADTHFTPHELSDNCSKLETLYTEFDLMRIRWNTCGPRISVPLLPVVSFVTCDRHPLTPSPPTWPPTSLKYITSLYSFPSRRSVWARAVLCITLHNCFVQCWLCGWKCSRAAV